MADVTAEFTNEKINQWVYLPSSSSSSSSSSTTTCTSFHLPPPSSFSFPHLPFIPFVIHSSLPFSTPFLHLVHSSRFVFICVLFPIKIANGTKTLNIDPEMINITFNVHPPPSPSPPPPPPPYVFFVFSVCFYSC